MSSFQYVMVPISLPSIAAVLRESNFNVGLYDFVVENYSWNKAVNIATKEKPDLIILNIATATYYGDREFVKETKKKLPKTHLTAIGNHATALPEKVLKETKLDSVVRGEPEEICLELAKAIQNNQSLIKVLGISFKKLSSGRGTLVPPAPTKVGAPADRRGADFSPPPQTKVCDPAGRQILHNPERPPIADLDKLPFPARDMLKNERYFMPVYNKPYTLIIASRGCPNHCIFCTAHCYYGRQFRTRSPKNVADEMEEIEKKYKIYYATMWADTFTLNKQWVLDFCDEIEKRRLIIKWMCNSRVNTVDLEMLKTMKVAGCTGIAYGVESGVQEILDRAKKGITLAQIRQAFKLTRLASIDSLAHIIFGLPGETKETIRQTIKFVKKLDPDYAQFYCAVPFPGTEFYDISKKEGWLATDDWSRYEINQPIIETPQLRLQDLSRAKKRAYLSFYLRPIYMLKTGWKFLKKGEIKTLILKSRDFLRDWGGV